MGVACTDEFDRLLGRTLTVNGDHRTEPTEMTRGGAVARTGDG